MRDFSIAWRALEMFATLGPLPAPKHAPLVLGAGLEEWTPDDLARRALDAAGRSPEIRQSRRARFAGASDMQRRR